MDTKDKRRYTIVDLSKSKYLESHASNCNSTITNKAPEQSKQSTQEIVVSIHNEKSPHVTFQEHTTSNSELIYDKLETALPILNNEVIKDENDISPKKVIIEYNAKFEKEEQNVVKEKENKELEELRKENEKLKQDLIEHKVKIENLELALKTNNENKLNLNVAQLKNLDERKNKLEEEKKEIQKQFEELKRAQLQLREDEISFNQKEQQKLILLEQKLNEKITNIEENANHLEKLSAFKTASTKLITDRQKFDKQNEFLLKRENVLVKEKMKLKESEAKLLQLQRDFDKQFSIIKRYLVPEDFAFTEILLLIKSHHLNCNKQKDTFPFVFLSYGWNTDENKNKELQEWLLKIKRDLTLAGIHVFLDIRNMQLNMSETMKTNIEKSDYIFIICTPRLKERAEEQSTNPYKINNLQIELNFIKK